MLVQSSLIRVNLKTIYLRGTGPPVEVGLSRRLGQDDRVDADEDDGPDEEQEEGGDQLAEELEEDLHAGQGSVADECVEEGDVGVPPLQLGRPTSTAGPVPLR